MMSKKVTYSPWQLRRLRAMQDLSLAELAERSGLTAPGIRSLENRKIPTARKETIEKLARALDVPVEVLCQPHPADPFRL
jgi:transcriptional regulator with XRE-family HTH domain